jgi:hypothetical protein
MILKSPVLLFALFITSSIADTSSRFSFNPLSGGSGDGTFYGNNNYYAPGNTCSFGKMNNQLFAAFPKAIWTDSRFCGACIDIKGTIPTFPDLLIRTNRLSYSPSRRPVSRMQSWLYRSPSIRFQEDR